MRTALRYILSNEHLRGQIVSANVAREKLNLLVVPERSLRERKAEMYEVKGSDGESDFAARQEWIKRWCFVKKGRAVRLHASERSFEPWPILTASLPHPPRCTRPSPRRTGGGPPSLATGRRGPGQCMCWSMLACHAPSRGCCSMGRARSACYVGRSQPAASIA